MSLELNQRLQSLEESATLALAARVRELKAAGREVISMSLGEPDFQTPVHIRQAAIEAIREGVSSYPPVTGLPELKQALASKLKQENKLDYSTDQLVVSNGAKHSLMNALQALTNPGDEVLLPVPFWVSYKPMTQLLGAVPVELQPDPVSLKLTPEILANALTERTRVLLFNSPNNPSGVVYTRAEMQALAEVLADWPDVWVVADEIYEYLIYAGQHVSWASLPGMYPRTVTVNGFSKGYAMTGWRVGYLAAPLPVAQLVTKLQGQHTSGVCRFAQNAAHAAVVGDRDPVVQMREAFRQRREDCLAALRQRIPHWRCNPPAGAFYLFPNVEAHLGAQTPAGEVLNNEIKLAEYLLDTAGVAVVPGTPFGAPGFLRLSIAGDPEILLQAIQQMGEALDALRIPA